MRDRAVFFPDDLDRINNKYFNKLRANNAVSADPSYWYDSQSEVALRFGLAELKEYRSDYGNGLRNEKSIIVAAMAAWDNAHYEHDSLSLCSSATAGSFAILCYLRHMKRLDAIVFETPCYFASLRQAEYLGFQVHMAPTYLPDSFNMDPKSVLTSYPKVVWLTQPRFGIGKNYETSHLEAILACMNKNDALVIDEATEQLVPSHLSQYDCLSDDRIIKLRSPFKGMGINGPRISAIIHGRSHCSPLRLAREQVQGAVDVFSLKFAVEMLADRERFFSMLGIANRQITDIHKRLTVRCVGTSVRTSLMQNGYIGSLSVQYGKSPLAYVQKREQLLQHCARHQMPVILGANLHFAIDERREFIRLSYFSKESDLEEAVRILSGFAAA